MPIRRRREKVFGPGRAVPLEGNAKARIAACARAWSARQRQPRHPHRGADHQGLPGRVGPTARGIHGSPIRVLSRCMCHRRGRAAPSRRRYRG